MMTKLWIGLALGLAMGAGTAADAKPFRMSTAGDAATMDPHSNTTTSTTLVLRQIYEPLVMRDRALKHEAGLALSWERLDVDRWRFKLRPNVKFHNGNAFNADDVVFSLKRTLAPASQFRVLSDSIKDVAKVDDLTIDIITLGPDPILLDRLTGLYMMDKEWSEQNNSAAPQDLSKQDEKFTTRNTNGTGPFRLQSREPDVKTVMARNPDWWGWSGTDGNVTELSFYPMRSDATRIAALLSGEMDFVLDPPLQDVPRLRTTAGMKVVDGAEARTMFFGMDQMRDELLYSSVKGKNPFKDKRVRAALYHAIDIEAIKTRVMRGFAVPTASMVPESIAGYTKDADVRLPYDRDLARKLMAEAGYPNGFEVTLDCSNNRYINDEAICQAAAAMWSQIGLKVNVNAMPLAQYFPKVIRQDTSLFIMGWGTFTFDGHGALHPTVMTRDAKAGNGLWNIGGYSNPKMDALLDAVRVELDSSKRLGLLHDALKLHNEEVVDIMLHHQVIAWATRANIDVVHRADNQLEVKWVKVN